MWAALLPILKLILGLFFDFGKEKANAPTDTVETAGRNPDRTARLRKRVLAAKDKNRADTSR